MQVVLPHRESRLLGQEIWSAWAKRYRSAASGAGGGAQLGTPLPMGMSALRPAAAAASTPVSSAVAAAATRGRGLPPSLDIAVAAPHSTTPLALSTGSEVQAIGSCPAATGPAKFVAAVTNAMDVCGGGGLEGGAEGSDAPTGLLQPVPAAQFFAPPAEIPAAALDAQPGAGSNPPPATATLLTNSSSTTAVAAAAAGVAAPEVSLALAPEQVARLAAQAERLKQVEAAIHAAQQSRWAGMSGGAGASGLDVGG
jgi:hypothetical protein